MGKQDYRKRCEKKIKRYKNTQEYQKLKERFKRDKEFEQQLRAWEYTVNGLTHTESKPKILMTNGELERLMRTG
jgi:hypothetical protein